MILINKIRTPDGTLMVSRSTHDYKEHTDKNGLVYMVDGGNSYLRRNVHKSAPYEELSLYSTDYFEKVREEFEWGTRGKGGGGPLVYKKLKDLSSDHIEAIIITQAQLSAEMKLVFWEELKWRAKEGEV